MPRAPYFAYVEHLVSKQRLLTASHVLYARVLERPCLVALLLHSMFLMHPQLEVFLRFRFAVKTRAEPPQSQAHSHLESPDQRSTTSFPNLRPTKSLRGRRARVIKYLAIVTAPIGCRG
jgi:hypothetical protein